MTTLSAASPAIKRPRPYPRGLWLAVGLLVPLVSGGSGQAADPKQLPPFEELAAAVKSYVAGGGNVQPEDLISQSVVRGALDELARVGWVVPNQDRLVESSLADDSFLIRCSTHSAGRAFLRKVAKMPNGYSQLDQLSSTNDGQKHVEYLIRQKDGHLLVKYLTTTQGGRNLGRKMARVRHGVDLNRPTARIYTVEQLLAELNKLYMRQL